MKKSTIILSIVICVFCMSAFAGAAAADDSQTIEVSGVGTVALIPDIVHISIGVNTDGNNITETINENTQKVNAVRDAMTAQGIAAEDIQTTNYNLYTQQKYYSDTNQAGDEYVYSVNNNFEIIVRDTAALNDILNACVDAGANNINSIVYDSSKRDAANDQAREFAIDDAISKAQKIADKLGVTLTDVQSISAGVQDFSYGNSMLANAKMADGIGGAESPEISAGSMVVSTQVELSYGFRK